MAHAISEADVRDFVGCAAVRVDEDSRGRICRATATRKDAVDEEQLVDLVAAAQWFYLQGSLRRVCECVQPCSVGALPCV